MMQVGPSKNTSRLEWQNIEKQSRLALKLGFKTNSHIDVEWPEDWEKTAKNGQVSADTISLLVRSVVGLTLRQSVCGTKMNMATKDTLACPP